MERKFEYIASPHLGSSHRSGWRAVERCFVEHFHAPAGIKCFAWLDFEFRWHSPIRDPWTGFLHNVIDYPDEYPSKYNGRILPLRRLVEDAAFTESLAGCRGIFTLSPVTCRFLKARIDAPVEFVFHPFSEPSGPAFDLAAFTRQRTRRVLMIGQWMRRFHSMAQLRAPAPYRKALLKVPGHESDYREMRGYAQTRSVEFLERVEERAYDELLRTSVVFLDLYDVAACNVILECIAMNVPLLINRLPGAEDYLGKSYPLFFDSIEHAAWLLGEDGNIAAAHSYLASLDKQAFQLDSFARHIAASEIFANLTAAEL